MAQSITMPPPDSGEKPKISYEEFLDTPWENPHVEWVCGEVVEMPPVANEHSEEGGWLIALVKLFLHERSIGVLRYEPFQMKTGPDLPGRSPDLMFISNERLSRLHNSYLEGPADVAVEIISPGSERVDRGEKYYEYEAGGVREYWLIDPIRRSAEFYRLDSEGVFRPVPLVDGVFRSEALPGFWLKVEWLWPGTQPPVLQVLCEWGII